MIFLKANGNYLLRVLWLALAGLTLVILLTSLPGYAARIASGVPGHGPAVEPSTTYAVFGVINSLASLSSAGLSFWLAFLLYRRKFENRAVTVAAFYLLLYCVLMTGPLEAWARYWLGSDRFVIDLQTILLGFPTVALLVFFPNGKLAPAWAGRLLAFSALWTLVPLIAPPILASDNLAGLMVLTLSWIVLLGVAFYALIVRYRRYSTPDERYQSKWFLYGFALWVGYMILSSFPFIYLTSLPPDAPQPWWSTFSELGWWLSMNIIPVTLVIAILRARLWDIDIVINRTLVYGALSLATMGLYVFVVGTFGSLLRVDDSKFIAFLATGLVAVLFQPIRARLQRSVNRLMYGERDDPVAVLTRLGEQLERTGSPEDALSDIVETVARALKLPYVAIEFGNQGGPAISYGLPRREVLRLPLSYQSQVSGYLIVAPRSPSEQLSSSDRQLLENFSHQAGAAAHAARLTADLRLSRQRLVTAREEERRRVRRDLHDGLGPSLASLTLKLDTARNLIKSDPSKVDLLLEDLKKQTQHAIRDIRELVYELRPPALDDFGLVGAIQHFIDSLTAMQPTIMFEVPELLPDLPAALEVAIYRISLEGLTNVIRHANANLAILRIFRKNDQLVVEISDDGVGMPQDTPSGVGLLSIQERCEELGGTFAILKPAQGAHIRASLPLIKE
jgi:signal transduction histidine kinase